MHATILIKSPFTVPAKKVINLTKLQDNTCVVLSGTVKFAKSSKLDSDRLALMSMGGAGVTFKCDASNPGILMEPVNSTGMENLQHFPFQLYSSV
ncbi:hypothetical protein HDU78_009742 [Chytriomyces hyalinus]|nr:hypothetical protein HDU78_009742 [Chytriomyces hyalinus]